MFRMVVQDARQTPTSGKVVAQLGSYDPHAKNLTVNKEKASFYLEHGAQPSVRAARLLQGEGVKLPGWVNLPAAKERAIRNPEKRRSTAPEQPAEPETTADSEAPVTEEAPQTEKTAETPETEAPTDAEEATETASKEEAES
jgi:small subunit ribosomal protein S16